MPASALSPDTPAVPPGSALPCGHLRLDELGRVVDCNDWLARALKRVVLDVRGQRVETLLTAPSRVFLHTHVMPTLRAVGELTEVYLDLVDADGAAVPSLWNAIVQGEVGERVTHIAVMVVRQRTQFERALLAARQAAEDARRDEARAMAEVSQLRRIESLATLAGGVAHDFNNLLCAIVGNVQLLRDVVPAAHPASEWLADTEQATRRATELAAKMLSYSGRARFSFAPVGLDALLERRAAELAGRAAAGLTTELAPGVVVEGDQRQLELLAGSLLENAVEATPPGEAVTLTLREALLDEAALRSFHVGGKAAPGRYAVLEVSDRGAGIAPAAREKLFEPFQSTKGPGRGLGLATSLGVVRAHRGAIRVESATGLGTTVTVALPLRTGPQPATSTAARGAKVLVVERDRSVRALLVRGLGRMGFEVLAAPSLAEGEQALAEQPDVACAVLHVAEQADLALLASLRTVRAGLPALVVGLDALERSPGDVPPGETRGLARPYTVLALGREVTALLARLSPGQPP